MLVFKFPIEAVAKQRATITRSKFSGRVYAFTPLKTHAFEKEIKYLAVLEMNKWKLKKIEGACRIIVSFLFKKPKKPKHHYPAKKDLDNCLKSVMDGLNGVAWVDDRQVCKIHTTKKYHDESYIWVRVDEIKEGEL